MSVLLQYSLSDSCRVVLNIKIKINKLAFPQLSSVCINYSI